MQGLSSALAVWATMPLAPAKVRSKTIAMIKFRMAVLWDSPQKALERPCSPRTSGSMPCRPAAKGRTVTHSAGSAKRKPQAEARRRRYRPFRPMIDANALSAKPPAVVRRHEIERRAERHDAGRVHMAVAAVIVPLDVIHVHGRGDAGLLVEVAQVVAEIGIVDDAAQIAFEVAVIDRVEAHQRREQPPVGLGDLAAGEVALARQPLLDLVERGK